MTVNQKVTHHYRHGGLLSAIQAGLTRLGLSADTVTIDDLAPVDEFHIGGRAASAHLLGQLGVRAGAKILDVGCGLGGGARFTAATYGAKVTGIDLTSEYVETGQVLCNWVGLGDDVTLHQGSALSMPFEGETFDGAYMMHVGMNIEDKGKLFAEVHHVLAPGAHFGVYDIMQMNSEDLAYPVPWATYSDTSWLAESDQYTSALKGAGFDIISQTNRRDFALEFFRQAKENNEAKGGPPPLGLHTLMQQTTAEKIGNMVENIAQGRIAPTEVIAVKR